MPAWSCLQHAPHGYDESWSKETLGHRRCAAEVGSGARCSGCSHCPTHAASTTAAGGGAGAARTSCRCAIPACRRSAGSMVQCPSCGPVLAAWLAARPAQAGSQTPSQVAAPAPTAVQGGRYQQAGASMPVRGSKLGFRGAAERANWRVLRVLPPPHERKLDAASHQGALQFASGRPASQETAARQPQPRLAAGSTHMVATRSSGGKGDAPEIKRVPLFRVSTQVGPPATGLGFLGSNGLGSCSAGPAPTSNTAMSTGRGWTASTAAHETGAGRCFAAAPPVCRPPAAGLPPVCSDQPRGPLPCRPPPSPSCLCRSLWTRPSTAAATTTAAPRCCSSSRAARCRRRSRC